VSDAAVIDDLPEILTPVEVAAWLQISASGVRSLAARGEIPAVKVGAQWRFSRDAVRRWLDLAVA
jgi:excisionase family DNA binding protein